MYHPYFRGKQYELMAIREMAPLLHSAGFCPVIEPVREPLSGLRKALDAVVRAGGRAVVVVNPHYGDAENEAPASETASRIAKCLNLFHENPATSAATRAMRVGRFIGGLRSLERKQAGEIRRQIPRSRCRDAPTADAAPLTRSASARKQTACGRWKTRSRLPRSAHAAAGSGRNSLRCSCRRCLPAASAARRP